MHLQHAGTHHHRCFCCVRQSVRAGISTQQALAEVCQQLQVAGGSFKKLRKLLEPAAGADADTSHHAAGLAAVQHSSCKQAGVPSHPLLLVEPLEAPAVIAMAMDG